MGRRVSTLNPFGQVLAFIYDPLDRATNSVGANGVSVTTGYDSLGRTLNRTFPDSSAESFGYTLGVTSTTSYTNQLGLRTTYGYDADGRKTAETNANLEVTQLAYDPAGDLLTLTDGNNHTTTWNYDEYGRVTNKVDAAGNSVFVYRYDADNHLTNRWSAAKGDAAYQFDPVGNRTNVSYVSSHSVALAFDVLNRLTNMVDAVGTTRFTYDGAGQLLSEDGPWTSDTVSYSYTNHMRRALTRLSLLEMILAFFEGFDIRIS